MDRTSSFVPMPENDHIFRKPSEPIRERSGIAKSAFSDLSNRVPRGVFRPGTPRKATFTGKPLLTFQIPQEKQENYDCLQFTHNNATEQSCGDKDVKLTVQAIPPKNTTENETVKTVTFTDIMESEDPNAYPLPESIHSNQDDLDYYASLPSPSRVHKSFDDEQDCDLTEELYLHFPYKDKPEFGFRLTPVEEQEMSKFTTESVYSEPYLGT